MGQRFYVIEHKDGGKWLTQYGWSPARHQAMRWPTEGDAEAQQFCDAQGHNIVPMEFEDDPGATPGVETDYDPWGIHRKTP